MGAQSIDWSGAAKNKKNAEFQDMIKNDPGYKQAMEMMGNVKNQQDQLVKLQGSRPGIITSEQNKFEKEAGVTNPAYEGTRDAITGQLLDQYKNDPYKGEALQALKQQAFAQGDSPWAKMQLEKQAMEQSANADNAAKANVQGSAQAMSQLMRQGGLSSGARTRMAMAAAKDLSRANQQVARQGMSDRLGIQGNDLDRKQGLLANFGNLETQAQGADLATQKSDLQNKAMFDMERYKQQMGAWGAAKTAEGQRAAAGGGGKK